MEEYVESHREERVFKEKVKGSRKKKQILTPELKDHPGDRSESEGTTEMLWDIRKQDEGGVPEKMKVRS